MQKVDHNRQKKIAVLNDFTGFGRCSLTASLPVISKLKVQCCPVPTAILSNHTGFARWYFDDYTERLQPYIDEWKRLDLRFHGISTGFLGSEEQFALVRKFLADFGAGAVIAVDPVMGDYGRCYPGYTSAMCEEMKELVTHAGLITPNLTEACLLTGMQYHEDRWHLRELEEMLGRLESFGPEKIVITGIPQGEFIANVSRVKGGEMRLTRQHRVGQQRSGTGDVFAAVIVADAVNGVDFETSVRRASRFVKRCIQRSIEMGIPATDGVAFEEVLDSLHTVS